MTDTVRKLMRLADTYADNPFKEGSEYAKEYGEEARQALYDELTKLFTPLSDEQIESRIAAKHFDPSYKRHASDEVILDWYRLGLKDGEAMHGIGETK